MQKKLIIGVATAANWNLCERLAKIEAKNGLYFILFKELVTEFVFHDMEYIVGCRGASQLRGSLAGIPPGYKANKL